MAMPKAPCNINIFKEKCPSAEFVFSKPGDRRDYTQSIGEKYFKGRCGRTTVIFEEKIGHYDLIFVTVSDKYITKRQLADIKNVVIGYRKEVEKYLIDNPAPPAPPPGADNDDQDEESDTAASGDGNGNGDSDGDGEGQSAARAGGDSDQEDEEETDD
jgi:hypothetical protein